MKKYSSWGRYPKVEHKSAIPLNWLDEIPDLQTIEGKILPYGQGRSYGDSCLNENETLLDTGGLSRYIFFDEVNGILRCEAGVTFADILKLIVPKGWFLPVTPGTKFVSVGGAIANDVHGKNHHVEGTFGCHVTQFELLRSDGEKFICSPEENKEFFSATIGGLGLTGLITWAEFRLKKIFNPFIEMDSIKFSRLDEYFPISDEHEKRFEYTVSWVDCTSTGRNLGRGIFMGGNHAGPEYSSRNEPHGKKIIFPVEAPGFLLNKWTIKAFNMLYYNKQISKISHNVVHYEPFFYPLDSILHWNRMYGKQGFLQYQYVIPFENKVEVTKEIFTLIAKSGYSSFLVVLKNFGSIKSPGMLSFPKPGVTHALDFTNAGKKLFALLETLDGIVRDAGGVVYPAKDARMSGENFRHFYPQWEEFSRFIDPKFSSSFWRRVTQ